MAANEEASPDAQKGGRFAKLKPVALAVVLLAVGVGAGVGGSMMLGGGAEASAAEGQGEEAAEEGAHGEAAAEGHGEAAAEHGAPSGGHGQPAPPKDMAERAVVNLGMFTVNLRGNGGGRVLRTEVQVEVEGKDQTAIEEKKALLRDAVITLVSDYTYADLEGVDGKTHLRDELVGRLNAVMSSQPPVDRLYFTEFVVQ